MQKGTAMQTDTGNTGDLLAATEVGGLTRSAFLLRAAIATAGISGLGAVAPFVSEAIAAGSMTDVEILNFALTLEYLESDFYNVKAAELSLGSQARSYAKQFGEQEQDHVEALTKAIKELGGTPVAKPSFNFPVRNEQSFLQLASTFENLGVGAYNGAAPMITEKPILAAAGSIVQVEARHAAAINLLIGKSPTPTGAFDEPKSKSQVLEAAKPYIR
jgi:hypothetical protein